MGGWGAGMRERVRGERRVVDGFSIVVGEGRRTVATDGGGARSRKIDESDDEAVVARRARAFVAESGQGERGARRRGAASARDVESAERSRFAARARIRRAKRSRGGW